MELAGKKLLLLGDSITQGCCASTPEKGFAELLSREYGLIVQNHGIGGTRIARQRTPSEDPQYDRDFCSRVEELEKDADIVLVFGGTNDHGHGDAPLGGCADRTPDTFWGACRYLAEALQERYPSAKIAFLTPLHRVGENDPKPGSGAVLSDYVNLIYLTAQQFGLPVLDLYQESAIRAHIPQIAARYTTDGLHPNDAGHAILANEIGAFLQTL